MNAIHEDTHAHIGTEHLFRLPWTMSDNAMTWLEPTRQCNITCDACFHVNDPRSRKPLTEIEDELDKVLRMRRTDAMLIAGGEPLTHPAIVEIVRAVKRRNCKPVLITNGVSLTEELLGALAAAGLAGITFHVDAHQSRPGWAGKSETELNILRQYYADMAYRQRGLSCAFNTTIFPDTLDDVPEIVRWAVSNIDRVHTLTLIAVRMASSADPWEYVAGSRQIDITETPYHSEVDYRHIMASEIYERILAAIPSFRLNAYLGGTALPLSPKWLIGTHLGVTGRSFGSSGARTMEFLQGLHHFVTGKYLAYTKPYLNRMGRSMLGLSLFDPTLRRTMRTFLAAAVRTPLLALRNVHVQSISIVQPVDLLPTGEADTCDGCPNKTYWNDRLVSACVLEDYLLYGEPLRALPKGHLV